jgi:hypothetical protein
VEIQSGATFTTDWLRGLNRRRRQAGIAAAAPVLVHGGRDSFVADAMPAWNKLGTRGARFCRPAHGGLE